MRQRCAPHWYTGVYQWFCHNGMKLNTKKTQMLVLGTAAMLRTLPPVSLRFCGIVIADAGVVKNLGVYVDRHLNFEAHVDCITRKCTGILIALSHTRNVIPRGTLKCIVEALVMSIVRYCLSIYGSCGTTQLRRVQKIVNFCVRVVTGLHRYDHGHQIISAAPVAERGTVSRLPHCMRAGTYLRVSAARLFTRHHRTEGQPATCV